MLAGRNLLEGGETLRRSAAGPARAGGMRLLRWWERGAGPALLGVYVVLAIIFALRRHATFQTGLFDLGYYAQVIWNTSRGRWFATSLKPPTFLADHFSPALALLAPFFWLAPDARALLVVEAVALATAIIPGYLLLRARYPAFAPLLVLAFVLNPLLHQTTLEEFHEIMLAAPALALAVYALETRRNHLLLASLGLALLVREDVALYVASFGLYVLVCRPKQRRQGVLLIGLSAIWLLVLTGVVMPALGDAPYRHTRVFGSFGDSIPAVIFGLARDPFRLLTPLLSLATVRAVVRVLGPLAGLPLLAPGAQLLWVPITLLFLSSSASNVSALQGWQMAPLLPLLWSSIALTLARVRPRLAAPGIGLLLVAALAGFRLASPFPGGGRFDAAAYQISEHVRIGHRVLATIPPGVSLAAPDGLGAHLATRQQMYLFPWFDLAMPPEMIVLDAAGSDTYPLTTAEVHSALLAWQMAPEVETVWEQDGYFVFRTTPAPNFLHQGPWVWAPWLRLEGYELAQTDETGAFRPAGTVPVAGRTLRVALYWQALARMEKDYSISTRLVGPDGQLVAQDDAWPARGALATSRWAAGRTIRDTHYLQLPAEGLPETLTLEVLVYETATVKLLVPETGYVLTSLSPQHHTAPDGESYQAVREPVLVRRQLPNRRIP